MHSVELGLLLRIITVGILRNVSPKQMDGKRYTGKQKIWLLSHQRFIGKVGLGKGWFPFIYFSYQFLDLCIFCPSWMNLQVLGTS